MNEGFTSSGFAAPSAANVEKAGVATGGKALSRGERVRVGASEAAGIRYQAKLPEEQRIQTLQKISSVANMPFQMEFFGMIGGFLLGGLASLTNAPRIKIAVQSVLGAPFKALRATQTSDLLTNPKHLVKNYWAAVNEYATDARLAAAKRHGVKAGLFTKAAGEKEILAAVKMADAPAMQAADRWAKEAAAKAEQWAPAAKAAKATAKPRSQAAVAKSMQSATGKFAQWRAERHLVKHTKTLELAEKALVEKPPGVFQRILHTVKLHTPETVAPHPQLAGVEQQLRQAKHLTGEALANHMGEVTAKLETLVKAGGSDQLGKRAAHVLKMTAKAGTAAEIAHGYGEAAKQGIAGIGKMLAKAGGRMSVFGALVTVGAVAGIGATMLTAKKERNSDAQMLKALVADIGDSNTAYVKHVEKSCSEHNHSNLMTTGLAVVGEAANGVAIASPALAGGGMFAASMLPMVLGEAVSKNPVLNAYGHLRQADNGEIKLETAQRADAIKQLIAIVPSVAQNGGVYNQLAKAMANEMATRAMTTKEILQVLAHDAAFTALATEVQAKQAAAKAAHANAGAPVVEKPVAVGTEVKPVATETVVTGKAEAANEQAVGESAAGEQATPPKAPARPDAGHAASHAKIHAANDAHMSKEAAYHAADKPANAQVKGAVTREGTVAEAPMLKRA